MSTKVFSYGTGFWAGVATWSASMSLFQDALGKEGYAQHVLDHWCPEWFSVPIATLALAFILPDIYTYVKMRPAVASVVESSESKDPPNDPSNS